MVSKQMECLTRTCQESEVKTAVHSHYKVDGDSTRRLAEIVGNPARGPGAHPRFSNRYRLNFRESA